MVTKPVPIWERWLATAAGKEKAARWYYILVVSVNVFIFLGLVLFFVFLVMSRSS